MKRLFIILLIFVASCRSFVPAPPANPGGVYQGFDSIIYDNGEIFGKPGIGKCTKITPLNDGCYIFQNIIIRPESLIYKFDTTFDIEYSDDTVIRKIRKMGTCTFGYNYLMIEYYIGEQGKELSQYKFIGWKN